MIKYIPQKTKGVVTDPFFGLLKSVQLYNKIGFNVKLYRRRIMVESIIEFWILNHTNRCNMILLQKLKTALR